MNSGRRQFVFKGIARASVRSVDCAPEVDRSNEPLICVCVNGCALGHKRARCEVIAGSAGEHDNLEVAGLLGKQRAKPVHPATVRRALRDCPVAIDGSDERLTRGITEIAGKLEIPFKPSIFCSSQIECIASVRSGFYASILPLSALDSTENRSLQIVDDPVFDPLSLTIALVWNERHCSVHPHVLDVKDALRRFLEGAAS